MLIFIQNKYTHKEEADLAYRHVNREELEEYFHFYEARATVDL